VIRLSSIKILHLAYLFHIINQLNKGNIIMNISIPKAKEFGRAIKIVDQDDINAILKNNSEMPRVRTPILLNSSFEEVPQNFVNCLSYPTYIHPHNHTNAQSTELLCWMSGILILVFFDEKGKILHKLEMNEQGTKIIIVNTELYHTLITPDFGVYLEVRSRPYIPGVPDRVYAPWAPPENTAEGKIFVDRLLSAKEGDTISVN
jgi:cupin fold WbuC family metalloprotein